MWAASHMGEMLWPYPPYEVRGCMCMYFANDNLMVVNTRYQTIQTIYSMIFLVSYMAQGVSYSTKAFDLALLTFE